MIGCKTSQNARFNHLIRSFLHGYWQRYPSKATFFGVHEYDARVESFFLKDVQGALKEDKKSLAHIKQEIAPENLNENNQIDLELLTSLVSQSEFDVTQSRTLQCNPDTYPRSVGMLGSLALTRAYAPLAERLTCLAKRLQFMPAILEAGKKNLTNPPLLWTQAAVVTTRLAETFYREALIPSARKLRYAQTGEKLLAGIEKVIAALNDYAKFLREDLLSRSNGDFADGARHFTYRLRNFCKVTKSPEAIQKLAHEIMQDTENKMSQIAGKIDAGKSWPEILENAQSIDFPPDRLVSEYRKFEKKAKRWVLRKKLASIPRGEKLGVVETPLFFQKAREENMQQKGAYAGKQQESLFFLTPAIMNLSIQMENITVHETYPGHHLQFLRQSRLSQIRKLSLDTMMTEGWGLYCEQLADEFGFYSSDIKLLQALQWLIVRAVRAIVDVGLHCQGMSFESAVDLLVQKAHFQPDSAKREVCRYTMQPTQPMSYLLGMLSIKNLRDKCEKIQGEKFDLQVFHDQILDYGSIPLSIIEKSMLKRFSCQ